VRADAAANREKLLDAASEVFSDGGVDAPLNLIAARAGVGKGTLYRHFADRDSVVEGLAERIQHRFEAIAHAARSAATGWEGLAMYIDGVTAMYFDLPWMVVVRARARRVAVTEGQAEVDFRTVMQRAWDEGSLRPDVDLTDFAFVISAIGSLAALPEPMRTTVMNRLRGLIFDGLRAEGQPRPSLGGEPLDIRQFRHYFEISE
jgi:AcrR family transcriptional regulator